MTDEVVIVQVADAERTVVVQTDSATIAVSAAAQPSLIVQVNEIGPAADPNQFFQTALLLSEVNDETKRTAARGNLGLQNIDAGTFF